MSDETTVEAAYCVGIRAKYIGPSNTLGSRWRVWRADETYRSDPDSITVPYDHALNTGAENAGAAIAKYLKRKTGHGASWVGRWIVASATDDSYVAVKVPR